MNGRRLKVGKRTSYQIHRATRTRTRTRKPSNERREAMDKRALRKLFACPRGVCAMSCFCFCFSCHFHFHFDSPPPPQNAHIPLLHTQAHKHIHTYTLTHTHKSIREERTFAKLICAKLFSKECGLTGQTGKTLKHFSQFNFLINCGNRPTSLARAGFLSLLTPWPPPPPLSRPRLSLMCVCPKARTWSQSPGPSQSPSHSRSQSPCSLGLRVSVISRTLWVL